MATSTPGYRVDDSELVEWLAKVRAAEGTGKTALKLLEQAVAKHIASEAQSSARSLGGVAAKSADSIRHVSASIDYGGEPYNMGAEFGSLRYHQFQPWRGNDDSAGYFLWPAIRRFEENPQRFLDLIKPWIDSIA